MYVGYLLMCTLLLTGVSFSGYVSTSAGSESARAAMGAVTVNYDPVSTTVEMNRPSGEDEVAESFTFDVSNSISEIAIGYDIVVSLDQELPDGVTMKLDNRLCAENADNTYIFSNVGTFDAGKQERKQHTLIFTGDYSIIKERAERKITISVQARQID